MSSSTVMVQVSVGEALDKYCILVIKEKYISCLQKLVHIQKEKETLFPVVSSYLVQCPMLYRLLEKVNTKIWFLVDETRTHNVAYHTIMRENDARFRIKRKINDLCHSELKEQKNIPRSPYQVYLSPDVVYTETKKECICEMAIYYDALVLYTSSPEVWNHLSREDPDISVVFALQPPEACDVLISSSWAGA